MSAEPLRVEESISLAEKWLAAIADASTLDDLEATRLATLGKKGEITAALKTLGGLPPEQRKTAAQDINKAKSAVTDAIAERKAVLETAALEQQLAAETIDVSLPPQVAKPGSLHPIPQTITEVTEIFAALGFTVETGPDVEDDFHNFTALNIPEEHPARQMHDTFYTEGTDEHGQPLVMRTHTSPVQIRAMQQGKPPFRIIAPGRTYRAESDATHTPMFHQIEGLVIDKGIHMGHLKWTLQTFLSRYFGLETVPMRLRPSFFPFTEPSAEVDIGCTKANGKVTIGAAKDGTQDWLEILGCGMVHPNVLKNCGLDPEEYQGFAFGMGVERLAMLKHGMPDLRPFFQADLRWLRHFNLAA